ncbi:MAG: hypothetical protein DRN06_06460 [Thermoprotei archaeon]|nr:MAG: hypothetical protein DRN06_06460 [Thermoprotei archaeon]
MKEFIIFALIVFIGNFIGNFINSYLPPALQAGTLGGVITFTIPVVVIYMLWKWARRRRLAG